MLTKRIIPCLDVKDGKVVKGKNFEDLMFAGEAVELGRRYFKEGADEIVFLDISASFEKRKNCVKLAENVAKEIFIPFTIGGGINNLEDIKELLRAGADKVSLNTSAVVNPNLISSASKIFGSQCIVIAIDAKKKGNSWNVFIKGGKEKTNLDALSWALEAERLGAGEILLSSIDRDGTNCGYDIELTRKISTAVNIPVIASGGAGTLESIKQVFQEGCADAALAASIFHYGKYSIAEVKKYLKKNKIEVRI